jgi:hypothetical protein
MKKLLLMAAASVAFTAVASAASATSLTDWTFDKVKLTNIEDNTWIEKDVRIWVQDVDTLDSAGKSLAVVNSDILGDTVNWALVVSPPLASGPGLTGEVFVGSALSYGIDRHALITGSVTNDVGIGQLNQDVGNNSNQGNVISAALVFGGDDLVDAEAYVEQINAFNTAIHRELTPITQSANDTLSNMGADLVGSFNVLTGVYMGNQNAGNMNSQHNVLSAAVGDNAFVALADAGLDQVNGANTSYDVNSVKRDLITGSINQNTGIVAFNQSVGNMNNQATVINVAALSSAVGL